MEVKSSRCVAKCKCNDGIALRNFRAGLQGQTEIANDNYEVDFRPIIEI